MTKINPDCDINTLKESELEDLIRWYELRKSQLVGMLSELTINPFLHIKDEYRQNYFRLSPDDTPNIHWFNQAFLHKKTYLVLGISDCDTMLKRLKRRYHLLIISEF
jgi:hypothetical protein